MSEASAYKLMARFPVFKTIIRVVFMDGSVKEYISDSRKEFEPSGRFILFRDQDNNLVCLSPYTIKDVQLIHTQEEVEE